MTDSREYTINKALVIVTANVYQYNIVVHITLDVSKLDKDEPDHTPHRAINYIEEYLPNYNIPDSYGWCKRCRSITVKTGSQARRVIESALIKIDDAISAGLLDRDRRKAEMKVIF